MVRGWSTPAISILETLLKKSFLHGPGVTNPLDDLPPKEALISLLSEVFQASLLREESRPIRCRLVLINPSELGD
jgi:hypothetical protein